MGESTGIIGRRLKVKGVRVSTQLLIDVPLIIAIIMLLVFGLLMLYSASWNYSLQAYDSDVFLASANAMTEDGIIVNIDGNSNRVSAIAQGPRKVVFIVGMNKICDDVDGAMKRARNVAAPINAQRFGLDTPCSKTGSCFNCKSPDTICCQFLITRFSRHAGRIHVILVNDNLGF